MGKPTTKKKKGSVNGKPTDSTNILKHNSVPKMFDEDTTIFIDMSQDMKEEGNKLFQKRDYEGAIVLYEKAIKLLPKNHANIAYLRSNLAACYMHMVPSEFRQAINECNLALEASPNYSKALLKRARCHEALNRFESACKDIDSVLALEPNNITALEISERIKLEMEKKGIMLDDKEMVPPPQVPIVREKTVKEKSKRKKSHKAEDKVFSEIKSFKEEKPMKIVKLVFGEDIRCVQLPECCSIMQVKEAVRNRFPRLKAIFIKYKDKEGDLITITTTEELRWAEESADPRGSMRLYIVQVNNNNMEHESLMFEEGAKVPETARKPDRSFFSFSDSGSMKYSEAEGPSPCIDNWIIQFARLFKNHVGINSDACLDLHELGMKLYSEAIEDATTSEEAQEIFKTAEEKFQEMTSLALFNWGNVHMSRARKRLFLSEDTSKESVLQQVKEAHSWAQEEYVKAGKRYEEALKFKPDFYEGLLALGQQQFEQAKLSWYYAIGSEVDLDSWPSTEVLELFNHAEDNMEKGTEMWGEMEGQRIMNLSKPNEERDLLKKMGLDGFFKDVSNEEASEQASNMRSQINLLWGTMLYERSVVEFKLGLPVWKDCLMTSVEKFEQAGASPTDLAVMIKNHIANETNQEGLGFKIDEIVQAWNEMYDDKRWIKGVPSFRLEPLFRRRVPKLHDTLENL